MTRRPFTTESEATFCRRRLSVVITVPSSDPSDIILRRRFSSTIWRKMMERGGFILLSLAAGRTVAVSGRKIIPHAIPLRIIAPVIKFEPCGKTTRLTLQNTREKEHYKRRLFAIYWSATPQQSEKKFQACLEVLTLTLCQFAYS